MKPGDQAGRWHRPAPRRLLLRAGLGGLLGLAGVAAGGIELAGHGVLPGKAFLDRVDGACEVPAPPVTFAPAGPSLSGTFYSAARRRVVGYTLAYPPGHGPGSELPLILALHAYGLDHRHALTCSLAQAVALRAGGRTPLPPMAIVASSFFASQEPPSLEFLGRRLAA